MSVKFYAALVAISLAGCATTSTMPEEKYQQFSSFMGWTQKCFESNYMSPQTYADTKNATGYLLGTWRYETGKMEAMMRDAYAKAYASESNCRQTEANAYQLISVANQHRSDKKENQRNWNEALQEFNRSMSSNKPIYCNRIGTMTMCN
jgi:hypothetical protein